MHTAGLMGHPHHHSMHSSISQGSQQQHNGYDYFDSSDVYAGGEEWVEGVRVPAPLSADEVACTALAFDQCHEMLWIGYSNGRLTSHLLPTMDKYTSIVSNSTAVKQIVPTYEGVVAISDQMAVFRSRGCVHNNAVLVESPQSITCAHLARPDTPKASDHLLVGLTSGNLAAYDLQGHHPLQPIWSMDFYNATTALASSDDSSFACAGTSIGQLDLFDVNLRSRRIEASIPNAHSGSVVSMDMIDNYVLTCGVSSRSINPYDKNAPIKIYPDPLIKLFDLRTLSLVSSIPFPSSLGLPPSFVKFHSIHHAFYATDSEGELYSFDMADPMQYSQVCQLTSSVAAWDVSLTGEIMAAGSATDGSVALFDSGTSAAPHALLEPSELPLDFPPTRPPRPPLTLSPLEPAPASRYVFRPSVNAYGEEITPLSAWLPSIPDKTFKQAMTLVVAPKPTKVLHPDFDKKIQQKDTIGYTSHRGFDARNSFVYGQGRATTLATVDPRFADASTKTRQASASRASSTRSFDEADPTHQVPSSYKYVEIKLSKHGMDGFVFDFSKYNRTTHVGLENALPFAYMNAALQLMYFAPGVRSLVLGHLCEEPHCVACELGFLYHMMYQTKAKAPPKARSCQATNFLSALHQIADVAVFGLFDKTLSILARVERMLAFLTTSLPLATPWHRVKLSYDALTPESTLEAVLELSKPSKADLICVECASADWLTNSDVKNLWNSRQWLSSKTIHVGGEAFHLIGVVSAVVRNPHKSHIVSGPNAHLVTHVWTSEEWLLCNDFSVTTSTEDDALDFSPQWKFPCVLLFSRGSSDYESTVETSIQIPDSIFQAAPLNPGAAAVEMPRLPQRGDRVAIDTEFVIVEMEEAVLQTDGTRIVTKESRQSLARVSLLHGETDNVIVDDYVLPNEPVVDYLTRFSGLVAGDLDPTQSRHNVVSLKTAYMKLRYLVDAGCVFVGHGLRKDFRIVNIFVPPEQVIDTVELYQQPSMRKIALRFLCAYLLKAEIQLETHDSIEDARAALKLHNKYLELVERGEFDKTLVEIYAAGRLCRWKIADLE
ncbi:unnamed protein product [Aphanomyces euteiches]